MTEHAKFLTKNRQVGSLFTETQVDDDNQGEIVDIAYRPSSTGLPIETFTLASLRQRSSSAELRVRQRIQFELLILCRSERAHHEVDFEVADLSPDRMLHIRPGQVHRWDLEEPYDADLILLQPIRSSSNWAPGHDIIEIDQGLRQDLEDVLRLMARHDRSSPLSVRSLHAVRALLVSHLGLGAPHQQPASERDLLYTNFERLLGETDVPPRSVDACAQELGCSARTLTRACHDATGGAPKVLIDQAIALRAQRLLSVESISASAVASTLGFSELSHFSRFFSRVTGESPSLFAGRFPNPGGT